MIGGQYLLQLFAHSRTLKMWVIFVSYSSASSILQGDSLCEAMLCNLMSNMQLHLAELAPKLNKMSARAFALLPGTQSALQRSSIGILQLARRPELLCVYALHAEAGTDYGV